MATDAQSLATQAQCYLCYGIPFPAALEMALLAQIVANGGTGATVPPISSLPVVGAAQLTDLLSVSQGGVLSQETLSQINTLFTALNPPGQLPRTTFYLRDEFWGSTGPGVFPHDLAGWQVSATSQQSGTETTRPGTGDLITSAVSGNQAWAAYGSAGSNFGTFAFHTVTGWTLTFIFKALTQATTFCYVGLSDASELGGKDPFGIYLRWDSSLDAGVWRFVTKNGGGSTVLNSTIAHDANWHVLKISSSVVGTINFSVDGEAPVVSSTNITGPFSPALVVGTLTTAAATLRADMMELFGTLAR